MSSDYNIPNCLLIILHLHLLNYPLQNATGYDERLFDPNRGMREKSKAMEDITYFLVGKIEGGKERAKLILPTYPCLQPSDTSGFRIALAKYLEMLRNAIVHKTHASQLDSASREDDVVWWWKDVVVRKSILDECSGDRFERLILALSNHAVLKNTIRTSPSLQPSSTQGHGHDLSTLSQAYTSALATAQTARLGWERPAALLVQRQLDLAAIRARIANPKLSASSIYDSFTTDRLLSLRESRQQDLLHNSWKGKEGRAALQFITELAGLVDPTALLGTDMVSESKIEGRGAQSQADTHAHRYEAIAETPSPLPIAAARHPAHLHSLGLPIFPKAKPSQSSNDEHTGNAGPSTFRAIAERLAAIEKVQSSLHDALENARVMQVRLRQRLQRVQTQGAAQPSVPKPKSNQLQLEVSIWDRRAGGTIDFNKLPGPSALLKFGLAAAPSENAIEERIAHIRTVSLPPFTADPHPASDSDPEPTFTAPQRASQLRPPSSRPHDSAHAPNVSRGLPRNRSAPTATAKAAGPSRQVRVVTEGPRHKAGRVLSAAASQCVQDGQTAGTTARRMSRRASAARARRSTMFGRGEDAEILRIVEAVQDRSDTEEDGPQPGLHRPHTNVPAHVAHTPRTPGRNWVTRGILLSSVNKSAPRPSFDIDKYERVNIPRLPSLTLEAAQERAEKHDFNDYKGAQTGAFAVDVTAGDTDEAAEDREVAYEGNSMTLADILLNAAHHENASTQLLDEEELEYTSE